MQGRAEDGVWGVVGRAAKQIPLSKVQIESDPHSSRNILSDFIAASFIGCTYLPLHTRTLLIPSSICLQKKGKKSNKKPSWNAEEAGEERYLSFMSMWTCGINLGRGEAVWGGGGGGRTIHISPSSFSSCLDSSVLVAFLFPNWI